MRKFWKLELKRGKYLAHANGGPRFKKICCPFSSTFILISAQKKFHDPRTTPSGRKVRAAEEREKREEEEKIMVTIVATTFVPVNVSERQR
jgi:hypothetical protein